MYFCYRMYKCYFNVSELWHFEILAFYPFYSGNVVLHVLWCLLGPTSHTSLYCEFLL